jgi:hypothetical protein
VAEAALDGGGAQPERGGLLDARDGGDRGQGAQPFAAGEQRLEAMQELSVGAVGGSAARLPLVRGLHAVEIAQRAPGGGGVLVGAELLVSERGPPVIAAPFE